MTLGELLDGRCDEGFLSRDEFQALLNRCWSESMAERLVRRRNKRKSPRRSRPPAGPVEPAFETEFDLAEELR